MMNDPDNTYFIDPSSEAELVRLVQQGRFLDENMHVVPDGFDPKENAHILDLACGPGGWAVDVVKRYPGVRVTGVDINERMVAYGQALAQARNANQARFVVGNILRPLEFEDESFDLINARFLQGFMQRSAWEPLLKECFRLSKPGGMIRLSETATWIASNSPRQEELSRLLYQAFWNAGMSFSMSETAVTPMLKTFLEAGGYQLINEVPYLIDLSHGTKLHRSWLETAPVTHYLIKPFLLKWTDVTEEELRDLFQRTLEDMQNPKGREHWIITSAIGRKPLA